MKIKYKYTNGKDKDFVYLCKELDNALNEIVGGEENRCQYIEHNQLDDIHDVYIVYDGDLPIGCGSYKEFDEKRVEVKRVYVANKYRGQGISEKLMELIEQKAMEQGYTTMILETGRKMDIANAFYKKLGYNVIPNYGVYEDMEASICFGKTL